MVCGKECELDGWASAFWTLPFFWLVMCSDGKRNLDQRCQICRVIDLALVMRYWQIFIFRALS